MYSLNVAAYQVHDVSAKCDHRMYFHCCGNLCNLVTELRDVAASNSRMRSAGLSEQTVTESLDVSGSGRGSFNLGSNSEYPVGMS